MVRSMARRVTCLLELAAGRSARSAGLTSTVHGPKAAFGDDYDFRGSWLGSLQEEGPFRQVGLLGVVVAGYSASYRQRSFNHGIVTTLHDLLKARGDRRGSVDPNWCMAGRVRRVGGARNSRRVEEPVLRVTRRDLRLSGFLG
jgi:hypothetical protein